MATSKEAPMEVDSDVSQVQGKMEGDLATPVEGQVKKVRWTKSKLWQWRATRGGHSGRL